MQYLTCLLLLPACCAATAPDLLALLQHNLQVSDRQRASDALLAKEKVKDTIYHVHIPKAAGTSFSWESREVLSKDGLKVASREGCYSWQASNPRIRGSAVLLRDPRKHVLSQYDYCTVGLLGDYVRSVRPTGAPAFPEHFVDWVQTWEKLYKQGWHGDFTPTAELISSSEEEEWVRTSRTKMWRFPPYRPEYHEVDPDQWPRLNGGGTCWHFVRAPFQCYVPISLQSQRLVCDMPLNYTEMPDAELAVRNMQEIWFVGIVEAYQPSICLLHAKLGQALPEWCDCRQSAWNNWDGHENNIQSSHSVALEELPSEILGMIDELTAADRQLYKAARVRFLNEIAAVEREHGLQIVCKELREQLEA